MPRNSVTRIKHNLRQVERTITRSDGLKIRFVTQEHTSPPGRSPQLLTDILIEEDDDWWVSHLTCVPDPRASGTPGYAAQLAPVRTDELISAIDEARLLLRGQAAARCGHSLANSY